MEYAYDDWCVAQMAKALDKEEDYEEFIKRAGYYKNVFDPQVKYVRQKHKDGSWAGDFDPFSHAGFVEGNSWQYTFFVPHDVQGLIGLMGKEEFNERLDKGFELSERWDFQAWGDRMAETTVNHGNQPNMQAAWLFNYSGKPWLTQKWTRKIMEQYYGTTPYDGWLGDEDQGQMGAWFVMSSMGLFEMRGGAAVKPVYEIGSPLFDKITIHLDSDYYSGDTFVIDTRNNSKENVYIQSATLNGEPLEKPWFYHSELAKGGRLVLQMGPEPNKEWGSDPEDAPPSVSDAQK
jgi:predicted alpha-1,2-mannosidase